MAETELSAPDVSAPGWFPRWVLTSYGFALGAAGAVAADQSELPPPLRALGVSSFVLGAGCVLLAARQRPARGAKADPGRSVPEIVEVPTTDPEVVSAEVVATEAEEPAEAVVETDEIVAVDEVPAAPEVPAIAAELHHAMPIVVPDTIESIDVTAEAARLERLEAELADERARVDRVTAELAALRRVVVEQRQKTSAA